MVSPHPVHRGIYHGGAWNEPSSGRVAETLNPGTGESLGPIAVADAADVDAAVASAQRGYVAWRAVLPLERAKILRRLAQIVRDNARELAMIDAKDRNSNATSVSISPRKGCDQSKF